MGHAIGYRRAVMLRAVLGFVFALTLLLGVAREARAAEATREGAKTVDLYTIGPGDYFYARYGHSVLCARDAGADPAELNARCYDYGVPDSEDFWHIGWSAVRARPTFVPVIVDERLVLDVFRGQGRSIDRQHLPLSPEEAARLVDRMEREVRERWAYAYHPYWNNCTTTLRDRIDDATGGKLRPGRPTPATARFREIMEEGLSGRLGELTLLAITLGPENDRIPNGWEVMFTPIGLQGGIQERLGAAIEKVDERKAVILPTSRAIGRIALFFLAFALFVSVRLLARRGKIRRALFVLAFALGGLGCFTSFVASVVVWSEISHNWALALLVPTDLALPWLPRRWLVGYARARIAIAVVLGVLELASVISQPLLPLVALVVLPLAGMLGALRDSERKTEQAVRRAAAAA